MKVPQALPQAAPRPDVDPKFIAMAQALMQGEYGFHHEEKLMEFRDEKLMESGDRSKAKVKPPAEEVDEALAKQKQSDDAMRY
jgi:hypothetical protein